MKTNIICTNFECNFTNGREDSLKIKDLYALVYAAGGLVEDDGSMLSRMFW